MQLYQTGNPPVIFPLLLEVISVHYSFIDSFGSSMPSTEFNFLLKMKNSDSEEAPCTCFFSKPEEVNLCFNTTSLDSTKQQVNRRALEISHPCFLLICIPWCADFNMQKVHSSTEKFPCDGFMTSRAWTCSFFPSLMGTPVLPVAASTTCKESALCSEMHRALLNTEGLQS